MTKPIKQRRNLVASFVASAVAASSAALIPHTAQAQIATATLEGHAVPGTRIVATNVDTGERREATATAAGVYSLIGLPAGRPARATGWLRPGLAVDAVECGEDHLAYLVDGG